MGRVRHRPQRRHDGLLFSIFPLLLISLQIFNKSVFCSCRGHSWTSGSCTTASAVSAPFGSASWQRLYWWTLRTTASSRESRLTKCSAWSANSPERNWQKCKSLKLSTRSCKVQRTFVQYHTTTFFRQLVFIAFLCTVAAHFHHTARASRGCAKKSRDPRLGVTFLRATRSVLAHKFAHPEHCIALAVLVFLHGTSSNKQSVKFLRQGFQF